MNEKNGVSRLDERKRERERERERDGIGEKK